MIAFAMAIGAALALGLALLRMFAGPTLHDRALAVKTVMIRAVLVCAALATAAGRSDWLDAAFALAFAALVLMVAVMKVFRAGAFQTPLVRSAEEA
ncbi:MAG: cation:proton antiporter [Phycisphaerales bacterium]|nr:cation:proton antiporter [Hyphomonadaceae bacterium]